VGDSGTISHTEDGGVTWAKQNSGTSSHLYSLDIITPRDGWAVGDSGVVLHYTAECAHEKGDINGDCEVDISEATRTVNSILAVRLTPTPHGLWAADCNGPVNSRDGDGVVDVLDIVKIVRLLLKLEEWM